MAKPLFQDIIPPDKRSIKRVPIPQRVERGSRRPADTPVNTDISDAPQTVRRLKIPDDERPPSRTTAKQSEKTSRTKSPAASIPATETLISRRSAMAEEEDDSPSAPPLRRVPFYEEKSPYRRHFPWKAVIVLLCAIGIIAGTYFVLSRFAKATITVVPKTQSLAFNSQFTGIPMATSSLAENTSVFSGGPIPYQVITLVKDGSMTVDATGQATVNTKASGQITIFNNYSASAQKLVSGTRFATPGGLIYRITSAVSVPGKTSSAPGSITATVSADQAGNQYNISLSDFVVPGLSGTAAYKTIYARSQTAMTGGFSGIEPKVDPASLAAAQATIDAELEGALITQVSREVPPTETLVPDAYVISYQHLTTTAASSSQAVINEEGTIHAFAFDTAQLANAFVLASGISLPTGSTPSGITWQIPNPSDLQFALTAASSTTNAPWNLSPLPFEITGTTTLLASIDTQGIKENLADKPRSDFNPILSGFPGVDSATMSIQPFWKEDFPADTQNITVTVATPPAGD